MTFRMEDRNLLSCLSSIQMDRGLPNNVPSCNRAFEVRKFIDPFQRAIIKGSCRFRAPRRSTLCADGAQQILYPETLITRRFKASCAKTERTLHRGSVKESWKDIGYVDLLSHSLQTAVMKTDRNLTRYGGIPFWRPANCYLRNNFIVLTYQRTKRTCKYARAQRPLFFGKMKWRLDYCTDN